MSRRVSAGFPSTDRQTEGLQSLRGLIQRLEMNGREAEISRAIGKHRPVIDVDALLWLCLNEVQRQLPDLRVGFSHVYEMRDKHEICQFPQFEFLNPVLGDSLPLITDQTQF